MIGCLNGFRLDVDFGSLASAPKEKEKKKGKVKVKLNDPPIYVSSLCILSKMRFHVVLYCRISIIVKNTYIYIRVYDFPCTRARWLCPTFYLYQIEQR